MKVGKVILSLVGIVILLVAAAAWYVLSNINSIVKEVVESKGSEVLQTAVELNHVDIKLLEGSASLGPFRIKNYEGFAEENLLAFETIKVDIDPQSLNQPVKVLDEVTISGISIVAEQKGTTTNLQTLMSKLPKSESSDSSAGSESSAGGQEVLLAIKKLNFVDNSLSLATESYGKHTLDLPKITQTNIGSSSDGLTPDELAVAIIEPLVREAQDQIEEAVVDLAKQKLEEQYGEKIDEEKEKLKEKAKDELGIDTDEVEDKLKDLKKLF